MKTEIEESLKENFSIDFGNTSTRSIDSKENAMKSPLAEEKNTQMCGV
jgi:hypothetical protein